MELTEIFALRLKLLRDERGLSQSQLGNALAVSRGSISYYEKCERVPDIEFLYRASKYFNVSVDYLLGISENKNPHFSDSSNLTGLSEKSLQNICDNKNVLPLLNALLSDNIFWSVIHTYGIVSSHYWNEIIENGKDEIVNHPHLIYKQEYIEFMCSKMFIDVLSMAKLSTMNISSSSNNSEIFNFAECSRDNELFGLTSDIHRRILELCKSPGNKEGVKQ